MINRTCPLCGADDSEKYYSFGAPNKIRVYNRICCCCSMVFQSPVPDFVELSQYYKQYMKEAQPDFSEIPVSFEAHILAISRYRLEFLGKFLRNGDRILDIGCSFGAMLKTLRDETDISLHLQGVNPEPSLAHFAIQQYGLDIDIGMFEDQDYRDGSFDFVILDNVLEHFQDPAASVARIYKLLSNKGQIFVATNNLDTPHGFFWQNFFLDHTVTFSSNTLQCLLESKGFRIIDQSLKGHFTYEGYHYPYQYVIAEKTKTVSCYDFKNKCENYQNKLRQANAYINKFFKTDRLLKKNYENSISKTSYNLKDKLNSFYWSAVGKVIGRKQVYVPSNHTLPPEKYYYRRLFVAVCTNEKDVKHALAILSASEFNPEYIFVLRTLENGQLNVQICQGRKLESEFPTSIKTLEVFWSKLLCLNIEFSEATCIYLNHSDIRPSSIQRYWQKFKAKDIDYACVDLSFFTDAKFEFVKKNRLYQTPSLSSYSDCGMFFWTDSDQTEVIWPIRDDLKYYLVDCFEKYYSTPRSISLDLSPQCNKKCDKCQFHSHRSPYAKDISRNKCMDIELAFKILDEASKWEKIPSFIPTFSGEPLLYRGLPKVLDYAKSLGFPISITTNGLLLKGDIRSYLLELPVDSIVISLDSFKVETDKLLQAPGSLSLVKNNILKLLEMRGRKTIPSIGLNFVAEKRNISEFDVYYSYWKGKVDFITKSIHQDQFSNNKCTLPVYLPLGKRTPCWSSWTCLYVRWNGDISFCGFDIGGNKSELNVKFQRIIDVWKSKSFNRWRIAQLENDFSQLYCKACPDWAGNRSVKNYNGDCKLIVTTPISKTFCF